ncbi:efflux transporter outer membrane subunit [Myxococcota bacterium]|nr:efflux transporter outer membrane subunit [Myxococcota bacterium]MBU1429738.1 efflux transporter outer membrane subunit [Myxococcota bacterium]
MRWPHPLILLALAWGCSPHTVKQSRLDLPLPSALPEPAGAATLASAWWLEIDPSLEAPIARLLSQSFDLRQTQARLAQLRQVVAQSQSGYWPQVEASGSAARARSYDFFGNDVTGNQYSLSLGAAYEVDLWGRVSAGASAARLDLAAAEADLEAMAMSLVGGFVEGWLSLVEQRAQRALLDAQIEVNAQQLELIMLRFSQGIASGRDVLQQRSLVMSLQSQIPTLEGRIRALENQLRGLLGEGPGALETPTTLPSTKPLPAVGLPAELIRQRPDVRAAERRLISADHRVSVALADRFPSLRLSFSTGYQAASFGDLLDRWIWNAVGSVAGPLFDGGRRAAEVARTRAVVEERAVALKAAAHQALREISDALALSEAQRRYIEALDLELDNAKALLAESEAAYAEGTTDYLPVLTALRALQQLEQRRLTADREQLTQRVKLYRALGGDWRDRLIKEQSR